MQICSRFMAGLVPALFVSAACHGSSERQAAPKALEMGGATSVTRFFVTSRGLGRGGDLGGLAGADAHCQALANAEGSGDHTWHAYLSTTTTPTTASVNARDRIGKGPWYNALGDRVAIDINELHRGPNTINQENALTERGDTVGDDAVILTGSRADGTAFPAGDDRTCANWSSTGGGHAQLGAVSAPRGQTETSWNSAHASRGCGQQELGGAAGGYCTASPSAEGACRRCRIPAGSFDS